MKNATKLILLVLFAFTSISVIGQSMLVKGGLNLAIISTKSENGVYRPKGGIHLGASYEQGISDILVLEIGPMLSMKGSNFRFFGVDGSIKTFYIDVPILVKEYFEINDNILIYGAGGPYLGLGLSGKLKNDGGNDLDLAWGSDDDDIFKRLDFGLSLGTGIDFNGIQVGFAFDLGLLNISSYTGEGIKVRNNVFRITAGYRLLK